jgi:hypothetical protein
VTANGFSNAVAGSAAHLLKPTAEDGHQNFRFYDNRQKYLLFVNTTSEKLVVANRILKELKNLHPKPPGIRLFDAGVGDGSVLTRVMRAMHDRYPYMPFYVVGKEISLEDLLCWHCMGRCWIGPFIARIRYPVEGEIAAPLRQGKHHSHSPFRRFLACRDQGVGAEAAAVALHR